MTTGNHPSRSKENLAATRAAAEHQRWQGQHTETTEAPLSTLASPNQPQLLTRDDEKRDRPTPGEARKYRDKGDVVSDVEHPVTGLGDVDVTSTMEGLLDREVSVIYFFIVRSAFDLDVWGQRSMVWEAGKSI